MAMKIRAPLFMRKYSYMHKKSQADYVLECAERSSMSYVQCKLTPQQVRGDNVMKNVTGFFAPCGRSG